jgi:hypothetical protein
VIHHCSDKDAASARPSRPATRGSRRYPSCLDYVELNLTKFDAQWVLGIHMGKIFLNAHSGIGTDHLLACTRQGIVTKDSLSRVR